MDNSASATADPAGGHGLPSGARSQTRMLNGIRMHYVQVGTGAPVVLLHGWPQTWYSWRPVMERLADRFTFIAPDLRGMGNTEIASDGYDKRTVAEDIRALISEVVGGAAAVVGHDMGGKAAYILAHIYPDAVKKLVLVDCQVPGRESAQALGGNAWHFGFHMAADFPEMLTEGREAAYIGAQMRSWARRKEAILDADVAEYARHYAQPGRMTAGFNYYRALRQDGPFAETLRGKPLAMPVMTISGEYGVANLLPDALAGEAQDLTSDVVPECGHFVVEEAPDFLCERLERFLA
ncbi:alpha/beta hydrolase [Xanthobacter sp. KR7-225]|uniref:alpha/beta fold hydrolase n=1 Tax=Xanthobacter sp. KR7-225 TaxID=3156613 RepID=UPI0032B3CD56